MIYISTVIPQFVVPICYRVFLQKKICKINPLFRSLSENVLMIFIRLYGRAKKSERISEGIIDVRFKCKSILSNSLVISSR